MDGVVEIITGRERRRRWSLQDKMRIVAESNEPGSMIRAVAARHGVCESLVFTWRRQAREGLLGPALASRCSCRCRRLHRQARRSGHSMRDHARHRHRGPWVRLV